MLIFPHAEDSFCGKYVCFVDSTFAVYLSTCFLMVFHIVLPASFWLIYAKKWAFPHLHSPYY